MVAQPHNNIDPFLKAVFGPVQGPNDALWEGR